ncbi:MAG: signal peptide peptidase SppA [candidate division WOR-3 bacterium]
MIKLLIISYFFYHFSPSLSTRSKSILNNPAGLSFEKGTEFFYSLKEERFSYFEREKFYHLFGMSMENFGFSFALLDKNKIYKMGTGIPLSEKLSFGISYTFGDIEKYYTLGLMARPFSFLSLGAKGDFFKSENEYLMGFALKPLTDRLTFSADMKIKGDSIYSYFFSFSMEPVSGLIFNSKIETSSKFYKEGTRYFFGLELSFGQGLLSYSMDKEDEIRNYTFLTSKEFYPKFFSYKNRWLNIRLKDEYSEEREEIGFLRLKLKPSFYDLLKTFERVYEDKEIEGVIIHFENPYFSPAQAEELRRLIKKISEKKHTVAYGENLDERNYYIASACDKIIIPNEGSIILTGPYVEKIYLKKFFEKIGIKAQIERIAEYKSAAEPLIRENISKEDSLQSYHFIRRILEKEVKEISESRNIKEDTLLKLMENESYFNSEDALKYSLIDTFAFENELEDIIKKWFNKKKIKKISEKTLSEEKYLKREFVDTRPKIALLTLEGSIIEGESGKNPLPFIGGKMLGSKTVQEILSKIEKDKSIKALVIRVNSPGGSALASEIIWNAIKRVKSKKPVVVSMGGLAASGGYYISCPAHYIFANYTTLTGSIGILGGKLVFGDMFEKIGITSSRVKTLKHSDAFSILRPWEEEELEKFRKELEWGYRNFLKRVSISRNLSESYVDSIGRGRIWSGYDAKNVRIVDEIGGIFEAIEKAKELAKIKGDVKILIFPEKKFLKSFYLSEITFKSPLNYLLNNEYIYYENIKLK